MSPGLLANTIRALNAHPHPVVCALAWHLGPDIQRIAIEQGYDRVEEDRLLASIDWKNNGYDLFSISTIAPASKEGFLGDVPPEASYVAMSAKKIARLGGMNPAFVSPGGGLVSHDFLARALEEEGAQPFIVLGEGSFHQIHGGVATNSKAGEHPIEAFHKEFEQINGRRLAKVQAPKPCLVGRLPKQASRFLLP